MPTQVANHEHKYFIRLNSMNRDRRRSSIHDGGDGDRADMPSPKSTNTVPQMKLPAQAPVPGLAVYGRMQPPPMGHMGHPVPGQLVAPAIGILDVAYLQFTSTGIDRLYSPLRL